MRCNTCGAGVTVSRMEVTCSRDGAHALGGPGSGWFASAGHVAQGNEYKPAAAVRWQPPGGTRLESDLGYLSTGGAAHLNKALRAGAALTPEQADNLAAVEREQSRTRAPENLTFYHGGTLSTAAGSKIQTPALVSTSVHEHAAAHFGPVSVIQVPKGTHLAAGDGAEGEAILPRSGTFHRVGVRPDGVPIFRYREHPKVAARLDQMEHHRRLEFEREMEAYI